VVNAYVKPKNPFATHSFNSKFNYSSLVNNANNNNSKKNVNTIDFNVLNTSVSNESLLDESNLSLNNEFKEFKYSSNVNNNNNNNNNTSINSINNTTVPHKNETTTNFLSIGNSNPPLKNNVIASKNNYYIFDENFKISKKPTHAKAAGSLNTESKFLNPKQDHSKLNALDANTSFRLPHVKSIESKFFFLTFVNLINKMQAFIYI
jgi:hypothetical protein